MNYERIIFFILIFISIMVLYRISSNKVILGTYKPYPDIIVENKQHCDGAGEDCRGYAKHDVLE